MDPRLDPSENPAGTKKNEIVQMSTQKTTEKVPIKKTLPAYLSSLIKPGTIGGDLCTYIIIPALTNGLYKVGEALLRHIILDQDIRPSGTKTSSGPYYYTNSNGHTDYTSYSQNGRTSVTVIDANGNSRSISNDRYNSAKISIFKIQHFDIDKDPLKTNPLPWNWADVEEKKQQLCDGLGEAIYASQFASVLDVHSVAGIPGAPSTATKWGWRSIKNMEVYLDPGDHTTMIINMGSDPEPIDIGYRKDNK